MFFSILIPVYKTAEYLDECLASVLSQHFDDYEIVLTVDGSPDKCAAMCDEYAMRYNNIRVVHKRNQGLLMTRRMGFKAAAGEYFICVDSDDYLADRDALQKIHDTILETNCDLVMYGYIVGAGGGKPERKIISYDEGKISLFDSANKGEFYTRFLLKGFLNNIWTKCPNKRIVDIDTDYTVYQPYICRGEDLFQSYVLLNNAQKIAYLPESLYYYRWTESSISNKPKLAFYDAYRTIYQREDLYLEKWKLGSETEKLALRRRILQFMDVIISGWKRSKTRKEKQEWYSFAVRVGQDTYFRQLCEKTMDRNILPYYRLIGMTILHGAPRVTAMVIDTVSFLSKVKHGGKKWRHRSA